MDKARNMLTSAGLTQEFWMKTIDSTKYILNMSPSSELVDTTSHEVWSGKKPLVSHLKLFGCDAFLHVPKKNRSNMDKDAVKCIFIG
jgi:hypothetical protein